MHMRWAAAAAAGGAVSGAAVQAAHGINTATVLTQSLAGRPNQHAGAYFVTGGHRWVKINAALIQHVAIYHWSATNCVVSFMQTAAGEMGTASISAFSDGNYFLSILRHHS